MLTNSGFNLYHSLVKFNGRQTDDILFTFKETMKRLSVNKTVSPIDVIFFFCVSKQNLLDFYLIFHAYFLKYQNLFARKNKIKILKCRLLNVLPSMLCVNFTYLCMEAGSSNWRWVSGHCTNITKTHLYNFDPFKPHFYIVKLGFTGVYIIFLISAQKHRLWVLVRTASLRRF